MKETRSRPQGINRLLAMGIYEIVPQPKPQYALRHATASRFPWSISLSGERTIPPSER